MNILKLLIASLLASQIFAAQGADITCLSSICSTGTCPKVPTVPAGLSWQNGSINGNCAINNCPANTSSGLVNASNPFCTSCPGPTVNGVAAVFVNIGFTGCVASTADCYARPAHTWTNSDCLACYGKSSQYTQVDKNGCQANPPGADVSCSAATCTTAGTCTAVPTVPAGLAWQNGANSGKCAITSCPASTSSGLTGASDLFCQSCPGTPNGSVQAVFANNAQTGCVASTATCGDSRTANTWTNADCLACYGNSTQYAKADKSGCQATALPSSSSSPSSSSTNSMIILSSVLFTISFFF
ncbi:cell surface immobilization antigen (macronuclear) [Tetrahymena thermophila SB210]|uniref:Cell surface immobilization antigen n=1 Tax=Tetrahymena thermophila (strain SB210) TaxID=312017 RepID=Q235T2_TETTS|nr:cell surface immobilization antigen [Tetrahymena thermophila SB210]EAR92274.1 cell surface immobilization antigen [Tetrahymena thermophila SB210]|eukprot:XP_001012519.1 cell surface immobilization antigen [Tetrahymena thermophila SB210]